ncbi:MAG: metallophosphoesterase family protein [Sandaracinaceae bacterium]|nr:metallophosphoesterase family protein [Sandaracinaceae bacterium]
MTHHRRALAALLALAPLAAGCPTDPTPDASSGSDAGLDASEDAFVEPPPDAPPDATLGPATDSPYKGPWVMRPTTTRAVVRWETRLPLSPPTIDYAPEDGSGTMQSATGTSTETEVQLSYGIGLPRIDEPDVPGTFYVNEVSLEGLTPATCYAYSIHEHPDAAGRFCTMHETTDTATPITFYAIGDTSPYFMGTLRVLSALPADETEFSVHVGDIQYYSTLFETQQYWFGAMEPLLRANAFLPCYGNHEEEIEHEREDIYERLFATPGDEPDQTFWYHYETGGVHFVSLSTEHDVTMGSEQYDWLVATLARIEAEPGYRFTVLYMHRPIYSVGDYPISAELRATMEPVIRDHRIPLVLAGHMHAYERFTVPYGAGADSFQVAYVTTGGGGFRISPDTLSAHAAEHPEDATLRVAAHNYIQAMQLEVTRAPDGTDHIRGLCADDTGMERDAFEMTCTLVAGAGPRCSVE